LGNGGRP
jgi:hypothetical protein